MWTFDSAEKDILKNIYTYTIMFICDLSIYVNIFLIHVPSDLAKMNF